MSINMNQPMSEAMYYILLSLREPAHGYGIMQKARELSQGRIQMGPGTLYGILTRMCKDEWVVLDAEGNRRKVYRLTDIGRTALLNEYSRLKQLVKDGSGLEELL